MKYAINAPQVPDAPGPFSMGTTAGRLIFTAGQLALDPADPTRLVEGGISAETNRILDLFEALLAECDCSLADIAKMNAYLTDLALLPAFERVIAERFSTPAPALSLVEVKGLPLGALIEMDCIACR